jgi:hypothetical protein
MRDLSRLANAHLHLDGPLLLGPNIVAEYEQCRRELALTDEHLATIARSS